MGDGKGRASAHSLLEWGLGNQPPCCNLRPDHAEPSKSRRAALAPRAEALEPDRGDGRQSPDGGVRTRARSEAFSDSTIHARAERVACGAERRTWRGGRRCFPGTLRVGEGFSRPIRDAPRSVRRCRQLPARLHAKLRRYRTSFQEVCPPKCPDSSPPAPGASGGHLGVLGRVLGETPGLFQQCGRRAELSKGSGTRPELCRWLKRSFSCSIAQRAPTALALRAAHPVQLECGVAGRAIARLRSSSPSTSPPTSTYCRESNGGQSQDRPHLPCR